MEWTQSDTLGNQRRVERTSVNEFDKSTGSASAPMIRRGTPIGIGAVKTQGKQHPDAVSDMESHPDTGVVGILAEAVADSDRRKPRPGRPTMPFVMPITYEGLDIVTSPEQLQEDVWAGDAVLYDSRAKRLTTVRSNYTYFIGVASVFAPKGSDEVQVRVDAFARCHTFDPSDIGMASLIDQNKYDELAADIEKAKAAVRTASTTQKATFAAIAQAGGDADKVQKATENNDAAVQALLDAAAQLLTLAQNAEALFANSNLEKADNKATVEAAMTVISNKAVMTST